MIALLVAVLYLPATAHCLLETAGWLPSGGDCCEQTPSAEGSSTIPCASGCCPSENAAYFSPTSGGLSPLVAEAPGCAILLALEVLPNLPEVVPPECSPPELSKVWQFVFRTASPPRAPSFAS